MHDEFNLSTLSNILYSDTCGTGFLRPKIMRSGFKKSALKLRHKSKNGSHRLKPRATSVITNKSQNLSGN